MAPGSCEIEVPGDPDLNGAILEKITPPGGSDASPSYLRDLGTILLVQADASVLNR